MYPSLSMRPAKPDDAEAISALIVTLANRFILFEFSQRGRMRFIADHTPEKMLERIQGHFRYHVGEVDAGMVGVVGIRDHTHLYHLFVAEPFQRRGVGRRLWEYAAAECKTHGNPGFFTVNSSRNAVAAYERFGFSIAGPVQNVDDVLFVPMRFVATEDKAAAPKTV